MITVSERVLEHDAELAKEVAKLEGQAARERWTLMEKTPIPAPRDGETASLLVSRGVYGHKAALYVDPATGRWASGAAPVSQKQLVELGYDRWRLLGPATIGGES